MPLSAISRRAAAPSAGPFASITYRELLAQRYRALKAVRRGRGADAQAMVDRIDAELEARRMTIFARHGAPV
ncbi:MAG: hypothetical protein AAFW98_05175 [Pseudomonadota bacterium]